MAEEDLEKSRGKQTVAELYNLADDIAEAHDLAAERPAMLEKLRAGLEKTIGSHENDGRVRYDVTQTVRWIDPR